MKKADTKVEKTEEKAQEAPKHDNLEVKKTIEVKPIASKDYHTRIKDVYKHLNFIHERMDKIEDVFKVVIAKVDKLGNTVTEIKDFAEGKNPAFERALREPNVVKPELTQSQKELYGYEAPAAMVETVKRVLGIDVGVFMKPDPYLPQGLLTLLIPERLSNQKNDFRSSTISNISAEADTKKWCERVKSNIYRTWAGQAKGTPTFLTG